eukprot:CAMPEP_0183497858 /NCGR_PEP_ID=MMETSP0371-20130417/264_1 /TAXON_ID=268820 /ORGANISM="Peridinium aciculiferum, Strain PAER-2" /LENGTH=67 /DNA_ID=CAMNT_0025691253 /DNA_START=119 /DNA_END=319 /DNA_ORIENTATION=-
MQARVPIRPTTAAAAHSLHHVLHLLAALRQGVRSGRDDGGREDHRQHRSADEPALQHGHDAVVGRGR